MYKDLIPPGLYCYHHLEELSGIFSYECVGMCPFWNSLDSREYQSNGYCTYLQKGDWGESGTFILWDQVKECGINEDREHDMKYHVIHD